MIGDRRYGVEFCIYRLGSRRPARQKLGTNACPYAIHIFMRLSTKILIGISTFLLVAFCTACSVTNHKVSNDSIDKINAANHSLNTLKENLWTGLDKCERDAGLYTTDNPTDAQGLKMLAKAGKCSNKLLKTYQPKFNAQAAVFDRVADKTSGKCEAALRAVATNQRHVPDAMAGHNDLSSAKFQKTYDAMLKTCDLKLEK